MMRGAVTMVMWLCVTSLVIFSPHVGPQGVGWLLVAAMIVTIGSFQDNNQKKS